MIDNYVSILRLLIIRVTKQLQVIQQFLICVIERHNYVHVKEESFSFYILIVQTFHTHQIPQLSDQLLQWFCKVYRTYKELLEDLHVLFKMIYFSSWEDMISRCFEGNGYDPPKEV